MMAGGRGSMDIDPVAQLSTDSRALNMSDTSALHGGENSLDMTSRKGVQHGVHSQYADPLSNQSKKLQDDLHKLGQKKKDHEERIKYLKSLKNKAEESILQMKVHDDPTDVMGEEETIEHVLSSEISAASLLCSLKRQATALSSDHSLTKDVVGIVATLGKVDDNNLSRLLSEYLGKETMLAVVCKTQEGVKALEAYNKDGSIDKSFGIHAFAASIGRPPSERFCVICLEDLRPYAGEFINGDSQRRLALLKPTLLDGENPPGFLGFAVNMITIDNNNLFCTTKNGYGLRETLFYNLFSNLQIYRSREDMIKAVSCIKNGAISLDGGIIRSRGVFALGHLKENVDLKFSNVSERLNLVEGHLETANQMNKTVWKKDCILEDIKREQALLDNAGYNFEAKKKELLQFLAGRLTHLSPHRPG